VIVDSADMPICLQISEKAKHLRELGMSDRAIARSLAVTEKTVSKAIALPDDGQDRSTPPDGRPSHASLSRSAR
jgi:transposase